MARGLSHAIASRIRTSETAGSAERTARGEMALSVIARCWRYAPARPRRFHSHPVSRSALRGVFERGLDHTLFGQLATAKIGDNAAVAENVDVVAMRELIHFGRVP